MTIIKESWWDRPGHQKNDPYWQRNGRFYVLPKSGKRAENQCFKKDTRNPLKDWFGWEKSTFFFAQLCPVVARIWFWLRSVCYFGSKKLDFGYRTPDFVNGSFVALGETVDLAPSDRFFVVSFPSYGRFRRAKKFPPSPLWGHRLPVTDLALSARRPFRPTRSAGWTNLKISQHGKAYWSV